MFHLSENNAIHQMVQLFDASTHRTFNVPQLQQQFCRKKLNEAVLYIISY